MKKYILTLVILCFIFGLGFLVPEQHQMPVVGASVNDWNAKSFWYYPWGKNRVHKGIDIFAKEGARIIAPTSGLVLFNGENKLGGNVVLLLGAKWRFHYFAHMKESHVKRFHYLLAGEQIGIVGVTGNAKGKQPHLHYSIKRMFPQFWDYSHALHQSYDRMFYLDPGKFLLNQL